MADGNTNFINATAFAAEKSINKSFHLVWSTAHPLLNRLTQRADSFGNAGMVKENKLILGLNYLDLGTPANGKSDANSLTPITPYAQTGFTQAEFEFSRYEASFYIRPHEKKLLMDGQRGNLFEGYTKQLRESFGNAISGDLAGNANAARENVLGLRYALSTSNTVGGISQTNDPYWAAQVRTSIGTFSTSLIDDDYDAICALGRAKPDLLLLSRNATVNVFGRMRDQVASLQRITSEKKKPNFNFPSFMYMDMDCVLDNRLGSALSTTGGYMMLSTESWFWGGDNKPILAEGTSRRLEGTNAHEFYYDMWGVLATNDIAVNAYGNGITA